MASDMARAGLSVRTLRNFVDGAFVDGGRPFESVNPATGRIVARAHEADAGLVDRAVAAARSALKGPWGRMSVAERAALLGKVAQRINERFDEFLAAEIADTGKPVSLASHIDIPRGAANFQVFAEAIKVAGTDCYRMDTPDGKGALNYAVRKPLGVVAVISPWNLPLLLLTWKVAPALACGNSVVVKPSEETPGTATLLAEVMAEVGMPPGVFNLVHGFGPDSAGEMLTRHPGVDAITFTGETRTGSAIMRAASEGIKAISFELGGKNPGIVFADCDLEAALADAARAVFANCGQVCLATERLYVQRPIFEQFVEGLKAKAAALTSGDPWDEKTNLGPLISDEHRRKVLSYYALAREEGAEVITGGGVPDLPQPFDGGYFVQPTIWTGLPQDARCNREEIFGPVCHVMPFDEEEEAVALANDSPYGLASAVWTRDLSRGHRVAEQMEAGINWVNCWFLRDLRTPFGGMRTSGIGREGGLHSLNFYGEPSNICIKL